MQKLPQEELQGLYSFSPQKDKLDNPTKQKLKKDWLIWGNAGDEGKVCAKWKVKNEGCHINPFKKYDIYSLIQIANCYQYHKLFDKTPPLVYT